MDPGGTIERNDHVIDRGSNLGRVAGEQQTRAENGSANAAPAEQARQLKQIGVHQRLSAREDHPLDAQPADVGQVALQFGRGDFPRFGGLPDVAHDAPAVAPAVWLENQDGQAFQPVRVGRVAGGRFRAHHGIC